MLEHLRAPFKRLIEPIAKALIVMGLSANSVTVIGGVGTIIVAIVTGVTGWLFGGAVALTLLVLADSLDGSIAMLTTGGTEFGAFLDSTLDRIADWAMLVGVIIFFLLHHDWWHTVADGAPDYVSVVGIAAAAIAVMTSFVTSYARARAESVGYEVKNGVATRADRLAIILVGMGIAGLTRQGLWLAIAMMLLAVLGLVTVLQRILEARRQMALGERTYRR